MTPLFIDVIDFQSFLNELPKRNIQRYRDMDFKVLVSGIDKASIIIHTDDLLATRTKNKYMKWLKAIFSFAEVRDLIVKNVTKSIVLKNTTKQREEREAFSTDEIQTLFEGIQNDELTYLFQILLLTGMRRSELYKCDVDAYNGVVCFDLTTVSQELKTASSYRIIPVHSSLLERINEFKIIRQSYTAHYLSKYFSRVIKSTLTSSQNKSLYSLRHTFATELISQGVTPEIVSELMGHAHSTMTMSRYVKGYPIKTLREAIGCLIL